MNWIKDLEELLFSYSLKNYGTWWANHFFYNREVRKHYARLRNLPLNEVYAILWPKNNE